MNIILSLVIHTANILGIFNDPFEFEGDYGPEVNPIRQKVFELIVSSEACKEVLHKEREYGPTLSELITSELIEKIKKKQIELKDIGFSDSDLEGILFFLEKYKDQKVFPFLRNNSPELLLLDKTLRDEAARKGRVFDLPILSSIKSLEGRNDLELKSNLIDAVFTKETFALTKPQNHIKQSLNNLNKDYLKRFFGETADNRDLEPFSSASGQVFFFWMYQALNLHLISIDPELIEQVNKVKQIFADTLGNPITRAKAFRDKLIHSNTGVLFTQESDLLVSQTLIKDGLFLPVNRQNFQDGTLVFLRSDLWEPDYEIIPIEGYEGFKAGRMNVILAKRKGLSQQFLLASCHGHSTKSEDARLQISLIMEKFDQLYDGNLQLLIGIDANTKTEEDVKLFRKHLDALGLVSTQVGPTTVKKRMVTTQHSKAGKFAIDEEDYLITLKPENGGQFRFTNVTVGFKKDKVDTNHPLPNIDNPSDHYPVGAFFK